MYTLYKWTRLTNYHKKAGGKKGKPHAKGLWKSFKSPIYSIGFTDVISQVNLHILIRELSSKSHFVVAILVLAALRGSKGFLFNIM